MEQFGNQYPVTKTKTCTLETANKPADWIANNVEQVAFEYRYPVDLHQVRFRQEKQETFDSTVSRNINIPEFA